MNEPHGPVATEGRMLFLSSPRGMGIAPIIKLSVVNGTYIPLLLLPRFHGFGANESQPARGFVFYTSVVMLKTGIAFLARLFRLAVLIEAGDGK